MIEASVNFAATGATHIPAGEGYSYTLPANRPAMIGEHSLRKGVLFPEKGM
jgi:hypothetical protein